MKRTFAVLVALALTVAALALLGPDATGPRSDGAGTPPDSVRYRESDVANVGKTGRPQLVEFFHPG